MRNKVLKSPKYNSVVSIATKKLPIYIEKLAISDSEMIHFVNINDILYHTCPK